MKKIVQHHLEPAVGNREQDDRVILQIDLRKDEQYMHTITNQIEQLVDTEKSLQEEPLKNNILSEEATMKFL